MRKSIIFAATFFALAAVVFLYCIVRTTGQKDQVEITHTTLAGDMQAAEGITFMLENQWSNRLFWNTDVTIDEEMIQASKDGKSHVIESKTKFYTDWSYTGTQNYRVTKMTYDDVEIYYNNGGEHWATAYSEGVSIEKFSTDYDVPFKQAILAVAEKTPAGGQYSQIIELSDYAEYYPIDMRVCVQKSEGAWYVHEEAVEDLLGINIPREHEISVTVTKNEQGDMVEYRTESMDGALSVVTCSTHIGQEVYFAFYGMDEEGNRVIPNSKMGNGIYKFSAYLEEGEYGTECVVTGLNDENINAFPLPEKDCYPMEMQADSDGNLLLYTKEAGRLVLRVIHSETMQEVQKIELMKEITYGMEPQIYAYEEYILIVQEDGEMGFITKEADGYKLFVQENLGVNPALQTHYEWNYGLDYQDGKLTLIFTKDYHLCSAYVYVFDENGLQYQGYFEHNADIFEKNYFYNRISPMWDGGVEIKF